MTLLQGKAAAISGAGAGIGRAHALLLAAHGAAVVVNDIDSGRAQQVVAEIVASGGRALANGDSIAMRAGAEALVNACVQEFGAIDLLVNNAGNLRDRSFLKMSDEEFDSVWQVHVKGSFWCAQTAARQMCEQGRGGVIINTCSGSHFGNFGQSNYAAAKGAIASLTYTWAIELARHGIRVNAICPVAATQMTQGIISGPDAEQAEIFWAPERNSPLLVYLASDEAANVSGQIFGTGGERLAHMVQPHYGKTLTSPGGWTVAAVREQFQQQIPQEFGVFGISAKPYPFHAGVKAPGQELS